MEAFIKFSYDVFGAPKVAAVIIILFITLFKSIKTRIDLTREEKSGRISEMIAEIERLGKPRYHFVVEQVFQNRFGFLLDYPAIKFFLKTDTPTINIQRYIRASNYLEFNEDYSSISYRKGYTDRKLKTRSFLYTAAYIFSSFIGFGLLLTLPAIPFKDGSGFATYMLFITSMLIFAYLSLDEGNRQKSAIEIQKTH